MEYQDLGSALGFRGMNFDFIPELLPKPDEPVYISGGNNIIVKDGRIKKIKGVDFLNDITTQVGITGYKNVLGMPIYRQYDSDKYLMAVTPRRLYYLKNDNEWFELGTIANGENDSVLSSADIDDEFIFVVSDSGTVYEWDGTTFAAFTFTAEGVAALKARFLLEHKTHLFLFRTIEDGTEFYQRMWHSNPGVPGTFSSEDKLDIDSEGVIQGAKALEDVIIVYLDKSIFQLTWTDVTAGYGTRLIASGQGLIAPKTLTGEKDVHYMLTQEGLMELRYGGVPRSVSDQKFNSLILDEIDPIYYYRAVAKYYSHLNQLYLCYPKSGSTFNDVQLIYDVKNRELVSKKELTNENYSAYGVFEKDLSGLSVDERKSYGYSYLPIFGTSEGNIKEQKVNDYQDGITNYESNIIIPPNFFRDRSRNKRVLQVDILVEKLSDEDLKFGIDLTNEMNENFGTYNYTITGTADAGVRRVELRSDDNDIGVDCFGKEFTTRIKDISNPYGWNFRGIIWRGYYSTVK